jgi:hypothetical protein
MGRVCRRHCRWLILSPWQSERNHANKDFFIIVNLLLTMIFQRHRGCLLVPLVGLIVAALRPMRRSGRRG